MRNANVEDYGATAEHDGVFCFATTSLGLFGGAVRPPRFLTSSSFSILTSTWSSLVVLSGLELHGDKESFLHQHFIMHFVHGTTDPFDGGRL